MSKLKNLNEMLHFLPELFPPDLSALTLSDCTHFINIWGCEGNELGESLKSVIYPGKPLDKRVMLGQVIAHKKKITKYYTKEESISGIPYLAVGVPIYEDGEMVGGICVVREETILETQSRCQMLLQVQKILADSMEQVNQKLEHVIQSYKDTRKINEYMQDVSQDVSLLQVNLLLELNGMSNQCKEQYLSLTGEIKKMADDTKEAGSQIIHLLNEFDVHAVDFFSSIRHIETIVNNMSKSIDSINNYLAQQSNMIIKGKKTDDIN